MRYAYVSLCFVVACLHLSIATYNLGIYIFMIFPHNSPMQSCSYLRILIVLIFGGHSGGEMPNLNMIFAGTTSDLVIHLHRLYLEAYYTLLMIQVRKKLRKLTSNAE